MQSLAVWLVLLPIVASLRCYDYMNTNAIQNKMHSWVDCPFEAQFCFKSYTEGRDPNGVRTFLESRSCGTPNLCQREGCLGDSRDKSCCCKKELCNLASSFLPLAVTSAVAYLIL